MLASAAPGHGGHRLRRVGGNEERRHVPARHELAHRLPEPVRRVQPGRLLDVHVHLPRRSSSTTARTSTSPRTSRRRGRSSNDGKTWTFKTQPARSGRDGQPLTAADAAWTINTDVKYKNSGAANDGGPDRAHHERDGPEPDHARRELRRRRWQRGARPVRAVHDPPEHIWSKYTGHNGADLKTFANPAPVVGSGPFKLVKFQKDQIALFQRNDSFYGPKPQIDEFGLQMFSDDDALVAALKANNIDAIEDVPATAIEDARRRRASPSRTFRGRPDRLHLQLEPEEAEEPRAAEPEGPRGVRPRDRPRSRSTTSSSSAPPSRPTRSSPSPPAPAGSTRHQARQLRPRAREQAPRRPRLQARLRRDPRRQRPQDVVHRHHADRPLERQRARSRSSRPTSTRSACS